MAEIANRYANQDLWLDDTHHAQLAPYVSRGDAGRPFARQVDAWWVALGVGVRLGQSTPLPPTKTKFNNAGILSSDPWRITHLELLALSEEGPDVLDQPGRVIEIASGYANAGMPWILDQMMGEAEPTLALINHLADI